MERITFRAMNCQMKATVDGDGIRIARRLEQVPDWFEAWEQRLSRFRPESELSRINTCGGDEVQISPVMEEVLCAALRASRVSGGLITPTVLGALETAGYDRSFDQMEEVVEGSRPCTIAAIAEAADVVQLKPRTHTMRMARGVRLDLGGVAKGWAADRAAHRLRRLGPALVDAGGDLAAIGPMAGGEPWIIGIENPFNSEKEIERVSLFHGGVATSGRDYRRWLKNHIWHHHIIDPRSGNPAQTDVLTATVIGPSAQSAEMAAKVVLILGSVDGIGWLNQRPELAGLVVLEDGEMLHSQRWMNFVWR